MISIINTDNICCVCEKPFKHKRKGFRLLGDELKTIFFITCHDRCNKQLRYNSLCWVPYSMFPNWDTNLLTENLIHSF